MDPVLDAASVVVAEAWASTMTGLLNEISHEQSHHAVGMGHKTYKADSPVIMETRRSILNAFKFGKMRKLDF